MTTSFTVQLHNRNYLAIATDSQAIATERTAKFDSNLEGLNITIFAEELFQSELISGTMS